MSTNEVFSAIVSLLSALGLLPIIQAAVVIMVIGTVIAVIRKQS